MKLFRIAGRPVFCLALLLSPLASSAESVVELHLVSGTAFVAGEAANGETLLAATSPDGRYVLATTTANNLTTAVFDNNSTSEAAVFDRQLGTWDVVSRRHGDPLFTANYTSTGKRISADGQIVGFTSGASDLVPDPGSSFLQAYLFDRATRATTLLSHRAGESGQGGDNSSLVDLMTPDGRWVVFRSTATDLVAGSTPLNLGFNLYLFDRLSGGPRLITHAASSPTTFPDDEGGYAVALSDDGRYLLFNSLSTDLVAGVSDAFGTLDTFVYDRDSNSSQLITRRAAQPATAAGGQAADLSKDGRYLLLHSGAALIGGLSDGNGGNDCFLFDRQTSGFTLISRSAAAATTTGNGISHCLAFSADDRYVYFLSRASDLIAGGVDSNADYDHFVFDRQTGTTTLVSHAAGDPGRAGNGVSSFFFPRAEQHHPGKFLYGSSAGDLAAGSQDTNGIDDLYLYDLASNSSTLVSHRGAGTTALGCVLAAEVANDATVVFQCFAADADPEAPDSNGKDDVYLRDVATEKVGLISATSSAGTRALSAARSGMSDDGRFIFYDGWLYDGRRHTRELVGHVAGSPGTPAPHVALVAIDAASRYVLLDSNTSAVATGITEGNLGDDVYLYDRNSDSATLISHLPAVWTSTPDRPSHGLWMSADAQRMVIESSSSNLLAGSPVGFANLYFYDRPTRQYTRISHQHGAAGQGGNGDSVFLGISPDERFILFRSHAQNLVPGFSDGNGLAADDLFLYDRVAGQATLISHRPGLAAAGSQSQTYGARPTGDWRYVYFESPAGDLVAGQAEQVWRIYRWDRLSGTVGLVFAPTAENCSLGFEESLLGGITPDGNKVLVTTRCAMVPGDLNHPLQDVYLYDLATGQFELISHQPGNPAAAAGLAWGLGITPDGRKVLYGTPTTRSYLETRGAPWLYDRTTREATALMHSYFDPQLLIATKPPQISRDGHSLLLVTPSPEAARFDPNIYDDVFLAVTDLFADGFESGSTASWSLTLP